MSFFHEQVSVRKEEIGGHVEGARNSKASDVFTMLVAANESGNENEKCKLTNQELVRCRTALGTRAYQLWSNRRLETCTLCFSRGMVIWYFISRRWINISQRQLQKL